MTEPRAHYDAGQVSATPFYYLETDASPEAVEAALEAAGLAAKVRAVHLQRASRVLGHVIAGYPDERQRYDALDTAMRWMIEQYQGGGKRGERASMSDVIHDIARPDAAGRVQVYGADAWYEFRLIDNTGHVEYDSATFGEHGMGYGSPAIALRDALIHDTD